MTCQGCIHHRPNYADVWPCAHEDGPDIDEYYVCHNHYNVLVGAEIERLEAALRPVQ